MGEIADMMLDGTLDLYTGEYIGKGNGIPRTLDGSLEWEKDGNNKMIKVGNVNPYNGVCKWLDNQYLRLSRNTQEETRNNKIIRLFMKYKTIPHVKPKSSAKIISEQYWKEFKAWVKREF